MDILALDNPPEVIAARTAAIQDAMIAESRCIKQANFDRIGVDDLARLFGLYDREFFCGWLSHAVVDNTGLPLAMRLSSTMTRAGGKTILYRRRGLKGKTSRQFEIAIASRMLFMTFRDVERPVVVGGLTCTDRLQALQRIMEHEIIHLGELLLWDESSCSGVRFKRLARSIFGHKDTTHALVTPREHAAVRHGVRVGSMVEFHCEGRRFAGLVNGIHHRATVLVEDGNGMQYTDGKKYQKYYVPLNRLMLLMPMEKGLP